MQIVKYQFQQHGDERGQLVALEEFNDMMPRQNYINTSQMIEIRWAVHEDIPNIMQFMDKHWKLEIF